MADNTYAIYSAGGKELAVTRMGHSASKAVAQEIADELGATVFLDALPSETDSDDGDSGFEAVEPRQLATS